MSSGRVMVYCGLALAWGCGGTKQSDSNPNGNSSASSGGARAVDGGATASTGGDFTGTGGASTSDGGSSVSDGGTSRGSGGTLSVEECDLIDGELAYGPTGAPMPLMIPFDDCPACQWWANLFGFRADSGYDLFWQTPFDTDQPSPNLFGVHVETDFQGGEARLLTESTLLDVRVESSPEGYVLSSCSLESAGAWIPLNAALDEAVGPTLMPADPAIGPCPRPIVSTSSGYLTAYSDARGLLVATLDEGGSLVSEEVLTEDAAEVTVVRLSKRGDRVLVGFAGGDNFFRYRVIDLQGKPVGDVKAIRNDEHPENFEITSTSDGWLIVTGYGPGVTGIRSIVISDEGLAVEEQTVVGGGVALDINLSSSTHGGTLLLSTRGETGIFGTTFVDLVLLDETGTPLFLDSRDIDNDAVLPRGLIRDPERDLIIFQSTDEQTGRTTFVQEYGCIDP